MTVHAARGSGGDAASGALAPLSAAETVVAGLVAAGVREVFGIAGGKFAELLEALSREPRLRWIGVRHEAAAAFMATAVAHRTGRLAACIAEMGPGALNLASGLDTAHTNHLPVLALTVGTPASLSDPPHGLLMQLDAPSVFGALTKWRTTIRDARRLPELMARAVRETATGAPGPVHLEIGYDVLGGPAPCATAPEVDAVVGAAGVVGRAPADAESVSRAADLLAGARRPLIIAGGGAVASEASGEVRELARRLDAPVIVTQMGIGTVGFEDPHLVGQGGLVFGDSLLRALRQADVVLAVGCRFSSWLWDGMRPAGAENPGQRLVHIDRDPTAIGRLRPAAVGLVGDARAVLQQLSGALGAPGTGGTDPGWRAGLRDEHLAHRARTAALGAGEADPMHPAQLAWALGQALPPDALVVYDGAHTSFWSNDLTPVSEPRTRFHDSGSGHLGFGVPYAHAVALLEPGRPVIDITGDGAFGFAVAELDTAVRYGISVVHVIHDNQAWGVIAQSQKRLGFQLGTGLEGTDYVAIARGFGAHAEHVRRVGEVGPALTRALAVGGPAVIDAHVRFDPHPGMPRFGAMGRERH